MKVRHVAAGMLAAMAVGTLGASLEAATLVPVKGYCKPDQPVTVQFLNEKGAEGKKALTELGLAATKLDGLFAPAAAADIAGADGKALFTVFAADGKALAVTGVKPSADGSVDLSALLPQIKQGGTYILAWKDATPLVIETLFNPGRGPRELERVKGQLEQLTPDQREKLLANFAPVVTHVIPLEYAVITTDKGVIKAKFSYDVAPHTIDNFIALSKQGYYDGSTFHRIISGFMIQGGDAYANVEGKAGTGGPGYEIMHEFSDKLHLRGTLSMARSSEPDSAGSQFFIMHGKTPSLDGSYSAFGDVFDGMDVVDAIAKTPVSDANGTVKGPKPKIVKIEILPATAEMYGLKP